MYNRKRSGPTKPRGTQEVTGASFKDSLSSTTVWVRPIEMTESNSVCFHLYQNKRLVRVCVSACVCACILILVFHIRHFVILVF